MSATLPVTARLARLPRGLLPRGLLLRGLLLRALGGNGRAGDEPSSLFYRAALKGRAALFADWARLGGKFQGRQSRHGESVEAAAQRHLALLPVLKRLSDVPRLARQFVRTILCHAVVEKVHGVANPADPAGQYVGTL